MRHLKTMPAYEQRSGPDRSEAILRIGRAQDKRAGSRPRSQPGRLPLPDPQPVGSKGTPPVSAPDGRPTPRPHSGPGQGTGARRPCLIADRAWNGDAPSARGGRGRASRPSFPPARGARTPSPTTRNGTRRATPWNGASAGSSTGGAWPPATPHTPIGSWAFCIWPEPGSGCSQNSKIMISL